MAEPVVLYVYDLSRGLAKQFSMAFVGKQIDHIYHTSIVVYGREYFFGGGIQSLPPGMTQHGVPIEKIELGKTNVPRDVFLDYLDGLKQRFGMENYHLLDNNCNHFSNQLSQFLLNVDIPKKITDLPAEFLNTPMGMMLQPMINGFFGQGQGQGGGMPNMMNNNMGMGMGMNNPMFSMFGGNNNGFGMTSPQTTTTSVSSTSSSHPKTDTKHRHYKIVSSIPLIMNHKPVLFEKGDIDPVAAKLTEFVKKVPAINYEEYQKKIQLIQPILKSTDNNIAIPIDLIKYFENLTNQLPEPSIFPVLEIIRFLMLKKQSFEYFTNISNPFISTFINRILINNLSKSSELITYRIIANCFSSKQGIDYLLKSHLDATIECTTKGLHSNDKVLKRAVSTVAYNLAVYLNAQQHDDHIITLVSAIQHSLDSNPLFEDPEIDFRLLMALGTLIYCSDSATDIITAMEMNFDKYNQSVEKNQSLIKEIKQLLSYY